jgi:hypothetical protein
MPTLLAFEAIEIGRYDEDHQLALEDSLNMADLALEKVDTWIGPDIKPTGLTGLMRDLHAMNEQIELIRVASEAATRHLAQKNWISSRLRPM